MTQPPVQKGLAVTAVPVVTITFANNRHEANRQEPSRPSSQAGGKAEGMQGVAFLHRESRPNTRPNRTQRPQR